MRPDRSVGQRRNMEIAQLRTAAWQRFRVDQSDMLAGLQ
jgi:hypothetical protein